MQWLWGPTAALGGDPSSTQIVLGYRVNLTCPKPTQGSQGPPCPTPTRRGDQAFLSAERGRDKS